MNRRFAHRAGRRTVGFLQFGDDPARLRGTSIGSGISGADFGFSSSAFIVSSNFDGPGSLRFFAPRHGFGNLAHLAVYLIGREPVMR